MAATTTLKLPDELKSRISVLAGEAGVTPHAFMIEALQLQTTLAERRRAFVSSAVIAEQEVARYGLVFDADEVFSYLKAKVDGKPVKRPKPNKC